MKSSYNGVAVPSDGKVIEYSGGEFRVPDHPIIPFIEGDGTGRDIWKASRRVFDAAVEKAYGGKRKIAWLEVFAGEKVVQSVQGMAAAGHGRRHPRFPRRHQRPAHHASRRRHPLAQRRAAPTARSLRLRPPGALFRRRSFARAASRAHERRHLPRKHRRRLRRNRMEVRHARSRRSSIDFLNNEMLKGTESRCREDSGIGIKPMSPTDTKRLVRRAIQHALENKRRIVTLVHKGNIMKFTEGAFRDWGYELADEEFRAADRHRARKLDRRQQGPQREPHRSNRTPR